MWEKIMRVAKERLYSFISIIVFFHSNHRILSLDSLYSLFTQSRRCCRADFYILSFSMWSFSSLLAMRGENCFFWVMPRSLSISAWRTTFPRPLES